MVMERATGRQSGFFAAAAWSGPGRSGHDPRSAWSIRSAGFVGAGLIGLAVGLTLIPIVWLDVFGRHRQIAYRGRLVAGHPAGAPGSASSSPSSSLLRVQGLLELPIALFMIALALVAEATLSAER